MYIHTYIHSLSLQIVAFTMMMKKKNRKQRKEVRRRLNHLIECIQSNDEKLCRLRTYFDSVYADGRAASTTLNDVDEHCRQYRRLRSKMYESLTAIMHHCALVQHEIKGQIIEYEKQFL